MTSTFRYCYFWKCHKYVFQSNFINATKSYIISVTFKRNVMLFEHLCEIKILCGHQFNIYKSFAVILDIKYENMLHLLSILVFINLIGTSISYPNAVQGLTLKNRACDYIYTVAVMQLPSLLTKNCYSYFILVIIDLFKHRISVIYKKK